MTEPNPDVSDIPLPDHVVEGELPDPVKAVLGDKLTGEWPDPVKATAPEAESSDEEADLDDDELDESAQSVEGRPAFPAAGPMSGSVVPPGYINPQ